MGRNPKTKIEAVISERNVVIFRPSMQLKIKLIQINKVRKMNEKAIDAFKTISEVSEELNIPQHVLRFWEKKFKYIKPMTRGVAEDYTVQKT